MSEAYDRGKADYRRGVNYPPDHWTPNRKEEWVDGHNREGTREFEAKKPKQTTEQKLDTFFNTQSI